ncbi:hypothetical protein Tco_0134230 [Tanacetum coccineum]
MTRLELFRIKSMWGNYAFDYACSMARGLSGGLISIWDPNMFSKNSIWCDDSFIIIKENWKNVVSLMTVLNEISTSQGNVHQNSVIESLPMSPIPVEDSKPTQEEIDILLVPDNLIPPGVEDADFLMMRVNESPILGDFFFFFSVLLLKADPSIPRPPPEPPDIKKCFKLEAGILIIKEFKGVSKSPDFMTGILPTLPTLLSDLPFISSFVSFEDEDTIFDPGIVTFLEPVAFSKKVSRSKYCSP